MTKKCYIGINNVAQKVKKGYIGVVVDEPVYGEGEPVTTLITGANISDFFIVNNGSYYFSGSGSVFTTNNAGKNNSSATTTLAAKKDMQLSFSYSYSSEAKYDTFSLTVAGTIIENNVSGGTTSKSWSGQLNKGDAVSFVYKKDASQQANDDKCTFSNMRVTITDPIQTGTIQKSIAKKIKKAYIGVGGIARPCWSGGTLSAYGTITSLSSSRYEMGATVVGSHAIFAGGGYSTGTDIVDAYNMSLSRQTISPLSTGRYAMGAATLGNYAIFGGGIYGSSATRSNVDAYDASLTQHAVDSLNSARGHICAAAVGDYAIFSGGGEVYQRDLTKGTPVTGATSLSYSAAVELGDYAIFAGGGNIGSTYTDMVSAFDKSLTRTAPTTLSIARIMLAGTTVGEYALFAGGSDNWGSGTSNATVDAYDTSLTKRVPTTLSASRYGLAATSIGDYALFAGGSGSRTFYTVVDVYDAHLTRSLMDDLSQPRRNMGAVTLGDYAIFAGGQKYNDNDKMSIVDAYTLS